MEKVSRTDYLIQLVFHILQRFGITTRNPNCPHTRIVRAATDLFTPEGKDYWMLSGTRIHNGETEQEYNFSIHSLKINDLIGVQVTKKGDLNYFVNGVNQGTAMSGIPSKKEVFGVFDVYGRTKQVSLKYFGGKHYVHVDYFNFLMYWYILQQCI